MSVIISEFIGLSIFCSEISLKLQESMHSQFSIVLKHLTIRW